MKKVNKEYKEAYRVYLENLKIDHTSGVKLNALCVM